MSIRPNPDELLSRVQAEESRRRRGKLRIFFGYAAGVGKTFAMLEAARREKAEGVDVVVGYVEPHGRPDTEALLAGLEQLPARLIPYHGVTLREFDLDAALARRPKLILVDELAHTNVEGSRHAKRWQDVEELLQGGIDVYTTLNVQHIESLNDVIAQITGVVVRETLPDTVLEGADEFELIDITPEELIERLRAGKVYMPEQAARALSHFFQEVNLTALRELSLRQAANRLKQTVDAARQQKAVQAPWATSEHLLVCVGPSPTSAKLIRSAKRMAAAFGARWLAVAVETRGRNATPSAAQVQVMQHLRMAERLGAETHLLVGANVADTVLEYARTRNVTKIVVGKTAVPWWRRLGRRTVVDAILERSGDIDVYVIQGERDSEASRPLPAPPTTPFAWRPYAETLVVVALCGLAGWASHFFRLAEANAVMIFLLGVVFVATRLGRGPAIFAAVANVAVFDFFFVPPYISFTVNDAEYLITFVVMLGIGLLISTLAARLRGQLGIAQQQERRSAALFRLTKQMSEVAGPDFLVASAGQQITAIFGGEAAIFLREADGNIRLRFGEATSIARHPVNAVVGQWVIEHGRNAGLGTDTLPNATAFFVPLQGSQRTWGALAIRTADPQQLLDPEQKSLAETCASLIALSLERDQSVLDAHQAQLQVESERLRSALLSSVSHDLRTPLASIAGASSALLDASLDPTAREELTQTLVDESRRMARLVDNLLDMTRLDAGKVRLNKQWHVLEEIIGAALAGLRRELAQRQVHVRLPSDLPLILVDGLLLEQVFVNLFENAARYTPADGLIEVDAASSDGCIDIRVADNGPGLPPGTEETIFDKFVRGPDASDSRRGVGLGLAICRAVIHAHAGTITACNRPGGGAMFLIRLPCDEPPPRITPEEISLTSAS